MMMLDTGYADGIKTNVLDVVMLGTLAACHRRQRAEMPPMGWGGASRRR
jgi:hypothetical protein